MDLAGAYSTTAHRLAVIIDSLCACRRPKDTTADGWSTAQTAFMDFLARYDETAPEEAGHGDFSRILEQMSKTSGGRKIIATARGLIGTILREVEIGDVCCIVFGCSNSLVLRPVPGHSTGDQLHYIIVGKAWIGGLMEGNTWESGMYVPRFGNNREWNKWGIEEQDIFLM